MNVAYGIYKNQNDKVGLHMIDRDIATLNIVQKLMHEVIFFWVMITIKQRPNI